MASNDSKSTSRDGGQIKLKEKMPTDVAGTVVDLSNELARNHESLTYRFEIINPNNGRASSLKQIEVLHEPVKSKMLHSSKIDKNDDSNLTLNCSKIESN